MVEEMVPCHISYFVFLLDIYSGYVRREIYVLLQKPFLQHHNSYLQEKYSLTLCF